MANSKCSEGKFRDLMFRTGELARDIGTVLVGEEAVKAGLIDEVGGLSQAVAKLREMSQAHKDKKAPAAPALSQNPKSEPPKPYGPEPDTPEAASGLKEEAGGPKW